MFLKQIVPNIYRRQEDTVVLFDFYFRIVFSVTEVKHGYNKCGFQIGKRQAEKN